MTITEKEYDKLVRKLEIIDTTRNTLLTFSFTTVLAVIGITITMKVDTLNSWLCLTPFFLIIPFAARIAYYRLVSAYITSFLKIFSSDNVKFEIGGEFVPECKCNCKGYNLISWLINHEMVLLSIVTSCVFYFKYISNIKNWSILSLLSLFIPILLIIVVNFLSGSSYDYKQISISYSTAWRDYAATLTMNRII